MAKKPTIAARASAPVAEVAKPADPLTVTIHGAGTVPIYANGAMRRVSKGSAIRVSKSEKAFLDYAGVKYR